MTESKLQKMQEVLQEQVQREYELGYNHVKDAVDAKKKVLNKLIQRDVKRGTVQINLLYKNIKLAMSLYLTDDPMVTFVSEKWVLSDEIMRNAELVREYDDNDMNIVDMRRRIIFENALYGLSITVIDGFDTEENQPISDNINPLSIIPDPDNWTGSRGRFFGFTRRVHIDTLKKNKAYTISDFEALSKDFKMTDIERSQKGYQYQDDEKLCDVYDHFTTYEGKKYLTTWINERSQLIRCVEIGECSEKELKKPSQTKYPIQLHRRFPLYGSTFGASQADEILQYQDAVTVLSNLQLIQARTAALWPDKFVNANLGIDVASLQNKPIGGRIIPVNPVNGNIGANIFYDQQPNPSQFPTQMIQELENRAEGNTGATALAFGQSLNGAQTKSEVQTLMQNTNQLLLEEKNNYLRWEEEYWKAHMEAYELYMPPKGKKNVALYKNGKSVSQFLTKNEFVTDGKMIVTVQSKSDIKKRNEADYAKLNAVAGHILPNMKSEYAMNEFLRKLLDTLDIYEMDSKVYIPETVSEIKARMNLELLNNNIDVMDLEQGEDPQTFLNIYKTALPTNARDRAIAQIMDLMIALGEQQVGQPMQAQADPTSTAMAMSTVNSQLNDQSTSLIAW